MLVLMDSNANIEQIEAVRTIFTNYEINSIFQKTYMTIVALNIDSKLYLKLFNIIEIMTGVNKILFIESPFKLTSANSVRQKTIIDINGVKIGGDDLTIIAGPCSIENREQLFNIAKYVKDNKIKLLRAGAFKPRTSPYSFQGIGIDAIKYLIEIRLEFGLNIVTEVTEVRLFDDIELVADIIQIGARNMQNFELLKRAGRSHKPILLKRGLAATLEEWLFAAEYILSEGNPNIILCERGIRTWSSHARNTFDVSIIPAIKNVTHLPVIVDPSHAVGRKDLVLPCALAAVAAGSDGLIVETHYAPDKALIDGPQALLPVDLKKLIKKSKLIFNVIK